LGSFATLMLGPLEIWSSKNEFQNYHGALFQHGDLRTAPRENPRAGDSRTIDKFSRPAVLVKDRLELMGYTLARARYEYEHPNPFADHTRIPLGFDQVLELIRASDVSRMTNEFSEQLVNGIFTPPGIQAFIKQHRHFEDFQFHHWDIQVLLENFEPYTTLRVLCESPANLLLPVVWDFDDIVTGGWAERGEFSAGLSAGQQFLIVTEGSSDALILKKGLELLRPHIADFFRFVDMKEGYPFTGTGSLVNFVKGLISIGIRNSVVIVFDNDAEGVLNWRKCQGFNVPPNMRIVKLPDVDTFGSFNTIGTSGEHPANINGCGAAIECYLDLGKNPIVRWSNFIEALGSYQGALVGKEKYKHDFLEQRGMQPGYDYSKLQSVLDLIVAQCVAMAGK
jgi:HEPN/Toprim N-terminal domain 1